jgi:hypothetical protein
MGNNKSCIPCIVKPTDDRIPVKKEITEEQELKSTFNSVEGKLEAEARATVQTSDSPMHLNNNSSHSVNTLLLRSFHDELGLSNK